MAVEIFYIFHCLGLSKWKLGLIVQAHIRGNWACIFILITAFKTFLWHWWQLDKKTPETNESEIKSFLSD